MIDRRIGKIQVLRGTELQRKRSVLEQGMFFYSIDKKRLYIGDGITQGGILVSNKNFIINSSLEESHPQAVYGDIIYNSYLNKTYIVNKDNTLILIIDTNNCIELHNRITSLSSILMNLKKCLIKPPSPPPPPPPPGVFTWIKEPQSRVVPVNSSLILEAEANIFPVAPITYRWVNSSGVSVGGINDRILTIASMQLSNQNSYACIAESTGVTSITSKYAKITVNIPNDWVQIGGLSSIYGEAAGDKSGWSVSMNSAGDRMAIGAPYNNGNGADSGHVRVYEYNGTNWVKLGSDIDGEATDDYSGVSVSMNSAGDRVAIGAPKNDGNGADSGHVRVYEYNGTNWVKLGQDIDGEAAGDSSGISVSMNSAGNRVAIGAIGNDGNGTFSGHVRVYQYNGSVWTQLGSDIDGEAARDSSGGFVSMNSVGDRVAIGARWADAASKPDSGHVRVYQYNGTNWVQLGSDIDGEAKDDWSGDSVSMNSAGNRVAIGAIGNDGNGIDSGHVRVYEYNGTNWVQLGQDINGEAAGDISGYSVSINSVGDRVAIGAYDNDGNGSTSGHVRVYQYNGSVWTQLGSDIDGEAAYDKSGWSVSMNSAGDKVVVGAPSSKTINGVDSGHAQVYEYNGTDWVKQLKKQDIDGEAARDFSTGLVYGGTVSVNSAGSRVAIGAPYNDGVNGKDSGHVRVYEYDGFFWKKLGQDLDGKAAGDWYGNSVSMNSIGNRVVIGAYRNSDKGVDAGHAQVYEYNGTNWIQLGKDIYGESAGDLAGYSVSINDVGNKVVVGEPNDDVNGQNSGRVRVYEYIGTDWVQIGTNINGRKINDALGISASINGSGTIVAIGATNGISIVQPQVRVYEHKGTDWVQLGSDIGVGVGESPYGNFGRTVSLNSAGNRVAIGGSDYNKFTGLTRVYEYDGTNWVQLGQDINGEATGDSSGRSVSMNSAGNRVAIGATGNNGVNGIQSGHVRVYEYDGTNWVQLGLDMDGEASRDSSGWVVSLNSVGDIVAIGAPYNDGVTGEDSGQVRVYKYK
jgi:hypothetical protein